MEGDSVMNDSLMMFLAGFFIGALTVFYFSVIFINRLLDRIEKKYKIKF